MNATKGLLTLAAAALLVASVGALAADLPVRAAPVAAPIPVAIPYYNWTGFYIGGNLGGAWEKTTLTDSFFGVSFDGSRSGFIGGGQIGYNWQISPQFVVGVEWMFDGTGIRTDDTVIVGDVLTATAKVDWITSVAARFGWAANNWLFYGKAGGGWVRDTVTLADLTAGVSVSQSDTKGGWLVGAGIEYGFTPNWTMRLEFDHLGLENVSRTGFFTIPPDTITLSRHFDMLTLGLNYKF